MELARKSRDVLNELTEQKILRAAYSERQLNEVMTDFWFNHFNVFAGKGATQQYLTEYERDVIRPGPSKPSSKVGTGKGTKIAVPSVAQ
jgi:uncharacterized protein (DUF1800 family)